MARRPPHHTTALLQMRMQKLLRKQMPQSNGAIPFQQRRSQCLRQKE